MLFSNVALPHTLSDQTTSTRRNLNRHVSGQMQCCPRGQFIRQIQNTVHDASARVPNPFRNCFQNDLDLNEDITKRVWLQCTIVKTKTSSQECVRPALNTLPNYDRRGDNATHAHAHTHKSKPAQNYRRTKSIRMALTLYIYARSQATTPTAIYVY